MIKYQNMDKKYNNWHKKFFKGLWNEVQLKMYPDAQTLEQTKFIIDALKLRKKDKILDVPCGAGRISNQLAKKGYGVVGIDSNTHMINQALKIKKSYNAKYFLKDMGDIDFENEFDSVICFWGSFGYFDDDVNLKFLENVYRALKPRGKFLLDTNTVESILSKFQKTGWFKVGNIYVLEYRTYDEINSRINSDWTFIKNGKIENKSTAIRLYTYKELTDLLKKIGFKKFTTYGSIKKEIFNVMSNRLYLVAEK
jgi:SAM-dependent methyltransferase